MRTACTARCSHNCPSKRGQREGKYQGGAGGWSWPRKLAWSCRPLQVGAQPEILDDLVDGWSAEIHKGTAVVLQRYLHLA